MLQLECQLEHTADLLLEKTPEKQWGDLEQQAGELGAKLLAQRVARATSAQQAMRSFRPWQKELELDDGLEL